MLFLPESEEIFLDLLAKAFGHNPKFSKIYAPSMKGSALPRGKMGEDQFKY